MKILMFFILAISFSASADFAQSLLNPKLAHIIKIQCDDDDDCPGFANYCFAGECNQDEYLCDSDDDCPGFNNYCFAGECNRQEPLCEDDDDCPGFANSCFAGECTNP